MKYINALFEKENEIEKLEIKDIIEKIKKYTRRHKIKVCYIGLCFILTILTLINTILIFINT